MGRLEGKTAIITGAAGGIGAAAARRLAKEGACVVMIDCREAPLVELARSIGASGSYIVADVTRPDDVQRYVRTTVERHGGVDVFLNNAGIIGLIKPIAEYPIDVFDSVLSVNVRGVWLGLKYVMPEIARRGGGSIVITASIAGVRGTPGGWAYVASKHAAVGLMRTAALEGAPLGIRVNSVNPSMTETPMAHEIEGLMPGFRSQIESRTPLKRYGTPEEVADLMLFLASDESRFCTGGIYMIDGGRTAM